MYYGIFKINITFGQEKVTKKSIFLARKSEKKT